MEMNDDLGATIDRLAAAASLLEQTVERLGEKIAAAEQKLATTNEKLAELEARAATQPGANPRRCGFTQDAAHSDGHAAGQAGRSR